MQREHHLPSCLFSFPKAVGSSLIYRLFSPKGSGEKLQDEEFPRNNFWPQQDPWGCAAAVFGLGLLSPQAEVAGEQKICQDQARQTAA